MSRALKRPMFRRGGQVNDGIMTGLTNRTKKAKGDIAGRARELTPELASLLEEFTPQTKLPLGQLGFNLASGKFAGDGKLQNLIRSAEGPYAQFTKADDARERAIKSGAVKLGINQAMSEAKPDKTSVLAAEKKAKILLRNEGKELTSENIIKKTSEIIQSEMRGKTYGAEANLERAISSYRSIYGEGSKAYNHAAFDTKVAPALKIALPASDISNCNAVIVELLSTPLSRISLSFVADFITKSDVSLLNLPNSVPSSLNIISAPLASNVMSPATSRRKSPEDISNSAEVKVALPVVIDVPTYNFLAILAPPSVLKAPVSPVASLASVVFVISTTPLAVIAAVVVAPVTPPLNVTAPTNVPPLVALTISPTVNTS